MSNWLLCQHSTNSRIALMVHTLPRGPYFLFSIFYFLFLAISRMRFKYPT